MKVNVLLSLILVGSMMSVAHADEADQSANTNTVKASDVQKPDEKTKDIDDEITNAKLRADSGSKSRFSMKVDLTYNGGNIEKMFAGSRPNYAGTSGTDPQTSILGTIGAALRLSPYDSLRAGTGVSMSTPFQNSSKDATNSNGERKTDVSNPYLDYSHSGRVGNTQHVFDTSYTQYTQDIYSNQYHMNGTYDINHTVAWDFEGSGWSPGINIDANYTFYKDSKTAADTASNAAGGFTDYTVALFPYVEYAFNDTYSFRTVFRFLTYDHYRSDASSTFLRELYTQSLGVGIAIARDVYLYPNLQFAPEHLKSDKTNVGLSTTINVF